jgi:hypothetical protein
LYAHMNNKGKRKKKKGAQKIKLFKNQWPNKEMGNWAKQNFLKGRNLNAQKIQEKMLTIPGHKGNAN